MGNVSASFPDNISMKLFYEVEPDGARIKFTIDDTGEIRVLVSLDREDSETENFTVTAVGEMDQRLTSYVTVIIKVLDQNDQAPQFDTPQYNFMITTGTRVAGRVSATDNDSRENSVVIFSIETSLNIPVNISNIGNNEAEVIVTDQTISGTYTFTIMATDRGGLEDSAIVTVEISESSSNGQSDDSTLVIIIAVVLSVVFIITIIVLIIVTAYFFFNKQNRKTHFMEFAEL